VQAFDPSHKAILASPSYVCGREKKVPHARARLTRSGWGEGLGHATSAWMVRRNPASHLAGEGAAFVVLFLVTWPLSLLDIKSLISFLIWSIYTIYLPSPKLIQSELGFCLFSLLRRHNILLHPKRRRAPAKCSRDCSRSSRLVLRPSPALRRIVFFNAVCYAPSATPSSLLPLR